ncbi:hypothetical protein PG22511B_0102 [Bifidobacterium pseudolongum subsp. globosum]|nr:hypothetical protein PG22511B_0102 [Bifidobacterium pseudolongum subsp. globosum]
MAEFITIDDVLALVPCMTRANLATMRHNRVGPRFFKPTKRTVLYDKKSVVDWVEQSAVDTSPTTRPRDTRPATRKAAAR